MPGPGAGRRLAVAAACVAGVGGALALLYAPLPSAGGRLVTRVLGDLAHLPLFAGVGLGLLAASLALAGGRLRRRTHYVVALAGALLLGTLSEGAQFFTARDADLLDWVRNLAGAGCGLAVALALDPALTPPPPDGRGRRRRRAVAIAVGGVLLASLVPLGLAATAYRQRDLRAPRLFGFDSVWERPFVKTRGVWLERTAPPAGWSEGARGRVGRIVFSAASHPYVMLSEPIPDWRGYDRLALELYSPEPAPVRLDLWLRDASHRQGVPDSWAGTIEVRPGANPIRIELAAIGRAPAARPPDLSRVRAVILLARSPERTFTLFLDEVRLERGPAPGGSILGYHVRTPRAAPSPAAPGPAPPSSRGRPRRSR